MGKVRALNDDEGRRVQTALPSYPVELIGLSGAQIQERNWTLLLRVNLGHVSIHSIGLELKGSKRIQISNEHQLIK